MPSGARVTASGQPAHLCRPVAPKWGA